MNTAFMPVTLDLLDSYMTYFRATSCRSADYTFTNLWGWADHYGLELSFRDDLCWIRQTRPFVQFWAPMGNWGCADWDAHPEVHRGAILHRVPDELTVLLQNRLGIERVVAKPIREQWEYLYSREELATLPGNRFHKKKNLVNQFRKHYGMDYRPLNWSMNPSGREDVLNLQEAWMQWRESGGDPSLQAENDAILRVVNNWERLPGLMGGSLYVENTMVAFAIGEPLDEHSLVLHFEKVLPGYKGVYQAINNAMAVHAPESFTILNREQDLGEEGMRHAKETYNPIGFLQKETLNIATAERRCPTQGQMPYLRAS